MTVTFDPSSMLPVLLPAIAAVLVLVLDAAAPAAHRIAAPLVATVSLAAAVIAGAGLLPDVAARRALCRPDGTCLFVAGPSQALLQTILLLVVAVAAAASVPIPGTASAAAPRAALLATVAAAGAAVVATTDLFTLVIGGAALALLPTLLVALRGDVPSRTAAQEYARWSLVVVGVLALGAALLVAAGGGSSLTNGIVNQGLTGDGRRPVVLAVVLLLVALGGLAALFPLVTWMPRVLAAASLPTAVVAAVGVPVAALGGLITLRPTVFALGEPGATWIYGTAGVVSLLAGAVLALRERDLSRLLGCWIVGQAGWGVVPLAAAGERGARAGAAQAAICGLALLTFVVGLTCVAHADGRQRVRTLEDLRGLTARRPAAAWAMVAALLTLVSLPPALGGAAARVGVLTALTDRGLWWLGLLALIGWLLTVIGMLRVVAVLLVRRQVAVPIAADPPARVHLLLLALLGLLLVVANLLPQWVIGPLTP